MNEIAEQEVAQEIRKGSGWVMGLGVLIIILGCLAIATPFVAGTATIIFVGWFILIGGVLELIHALQGRSEKAGVLAFLSGIFSILCGGLLLSRPMLGLGLLTLLLIAYFVVDGIGKIVVAIKVRPEPGWGLVLFGGIVTLLLGIIIWRQLPEAAMWAIGTLLGINMLFSGWSMVFLGGAVRQAVPKT